MADVVKRSRWWNFKHIGLAVIAALVLAIGLAVGPVYLQYLIVDFGPPNPDLLGRDLGLAMPGMMLLFATPIFALTAAICAFFRSRRAAALPLVVFSLCFDAFFVGAIRTSGWIRSAAFRELAERSAPLVEAIHRFEADTGAPPRELADLVPKYLSAVPGTGMTGYPEYTYESEDDPEYYRDYWLENPWVLRVNTSLGMLNWDMFLYLPRQNYPERGFGGRLERVGDWAYVHE